MKKFITLIALVFSMQANASFINLETETIGNELLVTLSVDKTAKNISEIHFNFDYDDSQLIFSDFSFNFAESLADDFISDAFDMAASVFVDAYWSDMFFDPALAPSGIFELGTITFDKLAADLTDSAFNIADNVLAADVQGSPVTYSSPSTDVPVPPTFSLLMLGLLAAVGVRKKSK